MSPRAAVLNAMARPFLEGRLPGWIEPHWFAAPDELLALAPQARIGWFDASTSGATAEAIERAGRLEWLTTMAAGVEHFPLARLCERGVVLTNGAGLNAITIAEYAVLGMLVIAKGYRAVARAQDRRQWLADAPGKAELAGSRALLLGAGGIGGRIGELLRPWGVEVVEARRHRAPGGLAEGDWRGQLGRFDWVIVTVPATPATHHLIGAAELAAMKPGAGLLNFARGSVLDQDALLAEMARGRLAGAFLDVTEPEPLPPEHPLWTCEGVHLSMHLSGRSQTTLLRRSAERFLANLARFAAGEPLESRVDLAAGY